MGEGATARATSVDAILAATRRVIAERGPERFTMSAVAAAAEVSRPTLYRWFPSKEALLEALTVYEEELYIARLGAAVEAQGSSGRKLDAAVRCLVTYLDGLMGPDPIGADPAFALHSLATSLEPQTEAFVRIVGDAMSAVPAVRLGHLSPSGAAELFLRLAYSHFLFPHPEPEVLLADLRSFAGISARSITTATG